MAAERHASDDLRMEHRDPESAEWLRKLGHGGRARREALTRLHELRAAAGTGPQPLASPPRPRPFSQGAPGSAEVGSIRRSRGAYTLPQRASDDAEPTWSRTKSLPRPATRSATRSCHSGPWRPCHLKLPANIAGHGHGQTPVWRMSSRDRVRRVAGSGRPRNVTATAPRNSSD